MMRIAFFLSLILYAAHACEEHMTERECSDYNKMMGFNPELDMTIDDSNTLYKMRGKFYHENDYNVIFRDCGDKFIRKFEPNWISDDSDNDVTNVAAGKTLSVVAGSLPGNPTLLHTITDGNYKSAGAGWTSNNPFWRSKDVIIEIDLEGAYIINGLKIQADCNDKYEFSGVKTNGDVVFLWKTDTARCHGMRTRPQEGKENDNSHSTFFSVPDINDIIKIQIKAVAGDNSYSVSEAQVLGKKYIPSNIDESWVPFIWNTPGTEFTSSISEYGTCSPIDKACNQKLPSELNQESTEIMMYNSDGTRTIFDMSTEDAMWNTFHDGESIIKEQGLCRDDGIHGGFCYYKDTTSSPEDCYSLGLTWSAFVAAEWRTSNGQCAILQHLSVAPSDCPSGTSSGSGNGGNTDHYIGNGNSDNVCWQPGYIIPSTNNGLIYYFRQKENAPEEEKVNCDVEDYIKYEYCGTGEDCNTLIDTGWNVQGNFGNNERFGVTGMNTIDSINSADNWETDCTTTNHNNYHTNPAFVQIYYGNPPECGVTTTLPSNHNEYIAVFWMGANEYEDRDCSCKLIVGDTEVCTGPDLKESDSISIKDGFITVRGTYEDETELTFHEDGICWISYVLTRQKAEPLSLCYDSEIVGTFSNDELESCGLEKTETEDGTSFSGELSVTMLSEYGGYMKTIKWDTTVNRNMYTEATVNFHEVGTEVVDNGEESTNTESNSVAHLYKTNKYEEKRDSVRYHWNEMVYLCHESLDGNNLKFQYLMVNDKEIDVNVDYNNDERVCVNFSPPLECFTGCTLRINSDIARRMLKTKNLLKTRNLQEQPEEESDTTIMIIVIDKPEEETKQVNSSPTWTQMGLFGLCCILITLVAMKVYNKKPEAPVVKTSDDNINKV